MDTSKQLKKKETPEIKLFIYASIKYNATKSMFAYLTVFER